MQPGQPTSCGDTSSLPASSGLRPSGGACKDPSLLPMDAIAYLPHRAARLCRLIDMRLHRPAENSGNIQPRGNKGVAHLDPRLPTAATFSFRLRIGGFAEED